MAWPAEASEGAECSFVGSKNWSRAESGGLLSNGLCQLSNEGADRLGKCGAKKRTW